MAFFLQALLGLASRVDTVNVGGRAAYDMCITDAAREMVAAHQQIAKFPAHAKTTAAKREEEL